MKIYCLSDIHGCLAEFEEALSMVLAHLDDEDIKMKKTNKGFATLSWLPASGNPYSIKIMFTNVVKQCRI